MGFPILYARMPSKRPARVYHLPSDHDIEALLDFDRDTLGVWGSPMSRELFGLLDGDTFAPIPECSTAHNTQDNTPLAMIFQLDFSLTREAYATKVLALEDSRRYRIPGYCQRRTARQL